MGADLPPELASRWTPEQALGGSEGECWRVHDAAGRALVLKLLPPGTRPREASLLLALAHPAIPAVADWGVLPDGRSWVLREYVPGDALSELAPLDAALVVALATELLELLGYLHQRGILHLDVKPANLVLRPAGSPTRCALLDLGLGARLHEAAAGGTPLFAAPEQHLGLAVDARTDLYGLGATLLVLLLPRGRRAPAGFMRRVLRDGLAAALDVDLAALPAPFPRLLPRLLAADPAARYADAQEALELLAGAGGRPSRAALAPDPVAIYGSLLAAELDRLPSGCALLVAGGTTGERSRLALHALATRDDVLGGREQGEAIRLERGGDGERSWHLPPPPVEGIASHLERTFALAPAAARDSAQFLLARATDLDGIATLLGTLADRDEIVPDGIRWVWPAAAAGRLTLPAPPVLATAADLRAAAASGHGRAAIAAWRRLAAIDPHGGESELRRALVDGLLAGGEPAEALVLAPDLPIARARALLDLGRIREAAELLASRPDAAGDAEARRIAAFLACHENDWETAVRLAGGTGELPDPADGVLLGYALTGAGRPEAAVAQLRSILDRLPHAGRPALRAAALANFGHALRAVGELDGAQRALEEARSIHRRLGHVRHCATDAANLGVIAKDQRRFDDARQFQREARALFEHVGDRLGAWIAEANLGLLDLAQERPGDALIRLESLVGRLEAAGARSVAVRVRTAIRGARELHTLRPDSSTASLHLGEDAPAMAESTAGIPLEVFRTFVAVNRRLASEADLGKAMTALLDAAVTLTGGRHGYLLLARADGLRREFESGEAKPDTPAFSRSLVHRAMQTGRTLTADDALADRELLEMPSIRELRVRSALCVPFRSAAGISGALYVEHPARAGAFGERDKQHLEILADQAAIAVERLLHEERLQQDLERSRRQLQVADRSLRRRSYELIGRSAAMAQLRAQIERLAGSDLPLLITGETGTGKELVARAIHERGGRHRGQFVSENCAAIPAELIESELFGVVRGAFTGADQDRAGLLELASGGTLFLDEVGDMPLEMQGKLLRALQERTIRRVGGSELLPIDCRVVVATHRDLRQQIAGGRFREDLYYRIAAAELRVPPLRERDDDVVELAEHFLARLNREHRRDLRLGAATRTALRAHRWPGNVRELEHAIARAFLLSDGDELQLDVVTQPAAPAEPAGAIAGAPPPVETLLETERRAIAAALAATRGDKTAAARRLGISRTALYDKLKRHGS